MSGGSASAFSLAVTRPAASSQNGAHARLVRTLASRRDSARATSPPSPPGATGRLRRSFSAIQLSRSASDAIRFERRITFPSCAAASALHRADRGRVGSHSVSDFTVKRVTNAGTGSACFKTRLFYISSTALLAIGHLSLGRPRSLGGDNGIWSLYFCNVLLWAGDRLNDTKR